MWIQSLLTLTLVRCYCSCSSVNTLLQAFTAVLSGLLVGGGGASGSGGNKPPYTHPNSKSQTTLKLMS
jgi:hypothetical protein